MSIRSKEIYVSGKTKKRLYWIRELKGDTRVVDGVVRPQLSTDEIADDLLNQKIEELYPNIKVLEKRLDALEGQLIGELLNPTTEK